MKDTLVDAVAFSRFLDGWLREDGLDELTDEHIQGLRIKWLKEFVPSLNEEHSGDCTDDPWSCVRCHTEDLFSDARRIISALEII